MNLKKCTLDELGLNDVPCGFEIKFYAADDPTKTNDLWWHVHSHKPVWNPESRSWDVQHSEGISYEIGSYEEDDMLPSILSGITPEESLIAVINKGENDSRSKNKIVDKDNLSGCQLESLIREDIGYKDICLYSNSDELLKHFSNDQLADSLCNDNERDLIPLIKELFSSHISLDDPQIKALTERFDKLLEEII